MNNDDVIYYINENADIKQGSLLEKYLSDKKSFPKGIAHISNKIEQKDLEDITKKEKEAWIFAFEMALTEEYKLTKEQLKSDIGPFSSESSSSLGLRRPTVAF